MQLVSIIWNFQYFARWLGYLRPKNWGLGDFTPKMGGQYQRNPQKDTVARARVVWAIEHENTSMGLTCEFLKRYK